MDAKIIKLNYEEAESIAKKYFLQVSGLSADKVYHDELLTEALQLLEKCKPGIDMTAMITTLDPGAFRDSTIIIGESQFTCTAFQQIEPDKVTTIFAYLMTLGECKAGVTNLAEEYYADLWGDGFLEAGRQILREQIRRYEIKNTDEYYISESFGPGFYGMPLDKLADLIRELDGSNIGLTSEMAEVCAKEKCSGGFFFITNGEGVFPAEECKDCIGHEGGCLFCGGKNLIPSEETCMELLKTYGTPPHVVRHCIAVKETAMRMAKALNENGENLDLSLVQAAALLHDIARTEENHGVKGAIIAEKHGYHQVAKMIKCHMFYATNPYKNNINEQDLLCLADRMVKENKYVGLDNRMQYVLDKLIAAGIDTERVRHRMEENRLIKERIEKTIGKSIDELME
ncbi:MAG: HD domain-containing protein [Clostridiales bacterium]|nr:HD domain-containing protein [Clostridiales bacterium]